MGKLRKVLAMCAMGIMALAMPVMVTGCGVDGEIDVRIDGDYVQWQVEGSETWNNLITLDEIKELLGEGYKGEQGNPGINGREVEFRKTDTHIQWRYADNSQEDDENWEDLILLSSLKGDEGNSGKDGSNGTDGKTPYIGENGNWWIGDEDTGVKTSRSIYKAYCESKPNYNKSEDEWFDDYLIGNLLLLPTNLGDVNLDGEIDARDYTRLSKYMDGEIDLTAKELANSDVDADGVVNETDLRVLRNAYLINSGRPDELVNFPVLNSFGDVNLDGVVNESDYSILTQAHDKQIELSSLQQLLAELDSSMSSDYSQDLVILREYLDGKIVDLEREYHFITLDFDGFNNEKNVDTYFYVKDGDVIGNLYVPSCDGLSIRGWISSTTTEVNSETIISSDYKVSYSMTLIPSFSDIRENVSKNLEFELMEDKTYNLKSLGSNTDVELVIPSYYNGLKVTSLTGLDDNTTVTSLNLPRTIRKITAGDLSKFKNLETIVVDDGNKFYDSRNNCNAVIRTDTNTLVATCKNTIIPSSVTTIGTGAFRNSTLTELILDENISKIMPVAFDGSSIETLSIKNVNDDLGFWWDIMTGFRSLKTIICDNKILANFSDYNDTYLDGGIIEGYAQNLTTIYFKEGLTVNLDFYYEFEQVESDLSGYVKYTLKTNE